MKPGLCPRVLSLSLLIFYRNPLRFPFQSLFIGIILGTVNVLVHIFEFSVSQS